MATVAATLAASTRTATRRAHRRHSLKCLRAVALSVLPPPPPPPLEVAITAAVTRVVPTSFTCTHCGVWHPLPQSLLATHPIGCTQPKSQSAGLHMDSYDSMAASTERSGGGANASHPIMQVSFSVPHILPTDFAAQDTYEEQTVLSQVTDVDPKHQHFLNQLLFDDICSLKTSLLDYQSLSPDCSQPTLQSSGLHSDTYDSQSFSHERSGGGANASHPTTSPSAATDTPISEVFFKMKRYSFRRIGVNVAAQPEFLFNSIEGLQETVLDILHISYTNQDYPDGMPLHAIYDLLSEIALSRFSVNVHISRDSLWDALMHLVFRGLIDQTVDDYHFMLCRFDPDRINDSYHSFPLPQLHF